MSFFDYFPTPKFLEMPAPGLALTDTGIKFIEFGSKRSGYLSRFGKADLPKGLINQGVIEDREALVHAIRNFRKSFRLRYIRTSLPEERSYLFQTTIPKVDGHQVRTVVESTIEENVPISVSEAVFDYSVLPSAVSTSDNTKVSVSVIPQQVVMEYLSLFREAGLVPLHFDVESQAVTKALVPKNDHRVLLVINLNHNKAGVYIIAYGAVSFTSTFAVEPPATKVMSRPHSEDEEAPAGQDIRESYPGLKTLLDETKRVLLYWKTQSDRVNEKVMPIESVILCGEESPREGLVGLLSKELSLPVELGNVWKNVFSLDEYIPEISFKESLSYAAAIGLAISTRQGMQ